jgi:hypothetical protein
MEPLQFSDYALGDGAVYQLLRSQNSGVRSQERWGDRGDGEDRGGKNGRDSNVLLTALESHF